MNKRWYYNAIYETSTHLFAISDWLTDSLYDMHAIFSISSFDIRFQIIESEHDLAFLINHGVLTYDNNFYDCFFVEKSKLNTSAINLMIFPG